uniref:Uncharacterized protein n=1 Tax=Opuntia streptacantha TaxID=393608 RepID=A0A7C9AS81_OPUST
MILRFSLRANSRRLGNLAIEPSSSTISQITPTGSSPASIARSTEASVWPALFKTPPSLYFNGNIWPGRLKSPGFESFDARALTVVALSWADTPVVVPFFASTVTVNAVQSLSSLSLLATIRGICSLSRSSSFMLTQTMPVPCFTKKAIASGVASSAAITISPSFSLSSSSTTMTIFP